MKKIIIEIETEKTEGIEIYLKEILNVMSKNKFFPIKRFKVTKSYDNNKQ
ncbi:MAG: hypothetical protein QXX99_08040 [Candidatus Bathyarchaeia archaeon]